MCWLLDVLGLDKTSDDSPRFEGRDTSLYSHSHLLLQVTFTESGCPVPSSHFLRLLPFPALLRPP